MTTSLTGVNGALPNLIAARPNHAFARPAAQQPRTEGTDPGAGARPAAAPAQGEWSPATLVTATAPEGTDPHLWSILTGEERAFFARTVTSGPLTYSKVMMPDRAAAPGRPSIRGGRVDIRV